MTFSVSRGGGGSPSATALIRTLGSFPAFVRTSVAALGRNRAQTSERKEVRHGVNGDSPSL